jgi:hypothetical protein
MAERLEGILYECLGDWNSLVDILDGRWWSQAVVDEEEI